MSNRQFVAVQFNPWDQRSYTYHNDGEPLAIGDKVAVDARGDRKTVAVVGLVATPPAFDTKPILEKVEPDEDALVDGDDRDLETHLGDRA